MNEVDIATAVHWSVSIADEICTIVIKVMRLERVTFCYPFIEVIHHDFKSHQMLCLAYWPHLL